MSGSIGSDIQRKSFYSVLSHEIKTNKYVHKFGESEYLMSLSELQNECFSPMLIFNLVREVLLENEEIAQALAHLKVKARQKVEFSKDDRHFYCDVDVMFFEIALIDALGFSERDKAIVYYELIKNFGRWITSEEFEEHNQINELNGIL